MIRRFRRLAILLIALLPLAAFAQTTPSNTESDVIDYIIHQTSIKEELNRSIDDIKGQFSQNPFGLPASQNEQMMKLFAKHFDPQSMLSAIRQSFQQHFDEQQSESTVEWLKESSTQKVLDYEKEFYTLQGVRKRVVNKYELEQDPPTQERTDLIDELIDNMSVASTEIESRVILFRTMITALGQLSSQRSFSESQIDTFVQNFRNQMKMQIDQQLRQRFLVKYHGLANQPLQDYAAFYSTEAGQWLSKATSESMHAALQQASDDFLNNLSSIQ